MAVRDNGAERLINATGVNVEVPDDVQGNLDFDINSSLLSSTELTDLAGDQATQLMTGEIPEDLQEQISDLSGSTALSGGFGMGEAGRKLTARDFGTTSMELQAQGAALASQTSQTYNQTAQIYAGLQEANRNYQLAVADQNTSRTQLAMLGAEMISKNQQYVAGLLNDLIINNSKKPIEGVQGNVDALAGNTTTGQAGYFDGANATLRELMSYLN